MIAAVLEVLALAGLLLAPQPPTPVPPAIVQLRVLAPAPTPRAKPAPPKPIPPKPAPIIPVTPPRPAPPPPRPRAAHHIPKPIFRAPPPPAPAPPITAPPAPVTAAPPISPQAAQSAMSRYVGEVRALVEANLIVPQSIIDAGLEGDCTLVFTLSPDGTLLSAGILTPSGLNAVDAAALAALRASTLPPFLPGMPSGPHSFTLPVHVAGQQD